ncbi:receptor-type tyrosine-protein phosphatase R-like isoform X4 [Salvelinus fontinalis]|uniref:receptor-type tyrosine-protein phosphatase R-like isoform X4 n=1 Tax=Salvelinus fontinalis TaxID=8038 RepID=UPI0024864509|nr:receptor-type tyrosine-protein phosphatase R-like isoform X4 [Salvelinus fontinalis]
MQQRRCGLFMVLSFLLQMGKADVFSGDHDRYMTRTGEGRRWSDSPVLVYRHVDQDGQEKTLGLETPGWQRGGDRDSLHALVNTLNAQHQARLDSFSRDMTRVDSLLTQSSQTHARLAKLMPAALLESRFRQAPRGHGAVSLLAQPEQEVRVENAPVSARYIVTVKNVLQDQHERDNVWTKEGFFAAVIFLTIFIIITTCLMVLYRLKEKVEYSDRQIKEQPVFPSRDLHLTPVTVAPPVPLHAVGAQTQPQVPFSSSMVQAEPAPPSIPTFIPPPRACRPPPTTPVPIPVSSCGPPPTTPVPVPVSSCGPPPTTPVPIPVSSCGPPPTTPVPIPVSSCGPPQLSPAHQKPCLSASPSPFRMKPAACLQERRGSNVSLVLDMSSLASVEPLNCGVVTPRERATQEYLQSSGRTLSRQQLRDVVLNTQTLHAEFAEIPMNFVDPKVMDISSHGTKNRYKTILPNPHSRVILRTKSSFDPLSSYINANYIRGYLGDEKAYIATQGPMINTVNDFWQMAWQEDCPVIIMITKLREKNEKCVLYWPERRGIYGKVEVLINNVTECDNYTCRTLTLKQGAQSRVVKHYWYTSWPDHKTPDSAQPLLQLMRDVEEDRTGSPSQGPVIVHCSAGIGRTGCFIATTIGCRQLEMEGVVDVLGIVCQLRADRGGLIQTGEQYEFVHHALSLFETGLSADTGQ